MPIVDRYRGANRMKDQSGWGGGLGSLPFPAIQPAGMPAVDGTLAGLGQIEEEKPWYETATDIFRDVTEAVSPIIEQGVELYTILDGEDTPVRTTTTTSYQRPAAIGGTTLLLLGGAALLFMSGGKRGRRR